MMSTCLCGVFMARINQVNYFINSNPIFSQVFIFVYSASMFHAVDGTRGPSEKESFQGTSLRYDSQLKKWQIFNSSTSWEARFDVSEFL
jgi:hypothetical protein